MPRAPWLILALCAACLGGIGCYRSGADDSDDTDTGAPDSGTEDTGSATVAEDTGSDSGESTDSRFTGDSETETGSAPECVVDDDGNCADCGYCCICIVQRECLDGRCVETDEEICYGCSTDCDYW